jgi:hypothetical protein
MVIGAQASSLSIRGTRRLKDIPGLGLTSDGGRENHLHRRQGEEKACWEEPSLEIQPSRLEEARYFLMDTKPRQPQGERPGNNVNAPNQPVFHLVRSEAVV